MPPERQLNRWFAVRAQHRGASARRRAKRSDTSTFASAEVRNYFRDSVMNSRHDEAMPQLSQAITQADSLRWHSARRIIRYFVEQAEQLATLGIGELGEALLVHRLHDWICLLQETTPRR